MAKSRAATKKPAPAPAKRGTTKPAKAKVEETVEEEVEDHGVKALGLEELEGMWEDAEAPSFGDVPDDTYQVRIEKAIREQKAGKWRVVFTLKIMGGDYKGRQLWKRDNLTSSDQIGYFKGGMARLGIEVKLFKELDGVLEDLAGTFAEISAKTKEGSEFQNYYFNKALDTADLEEAPDEDEPAEDVEEPSEDVVEEDVPEDEEVPDDDAPVEEEGDEEIPEDEDAGEEPEEDEEVPDEEPEPAKKPGRRSAAPAQPEPEVTIKFDEATAVKFKKQIVAAAKASDMDPADYNKMSDLVADVAEYLGISGEFKKVSDLLKHIESKQKAKK